jgi:hypothetical protein
MAGSESMVVALDDGAFQVERLGVNARGAHQRGGERWGKRDGKCLLRGAGYCCKGALEGGA